MKHFKSFVDYLKQEDNFLGSEEKETALIVLNNTEAIFIAEGTCNVDYCKNNNIPAIQLKKFSSEAGCVVGVKDDIFVVAKRKLGEDCKGIADKWIISLCEYLKNKGLNSAKLSNNDITVDNYKVASAVETTYNGWQYISSLIAINQDIEAINNICNKPMVKVPKALIEYGITTEEMKKFCEDYWSK